MPLFGPPDVEKLKAKGDVQGLIKALDYKEDVQVRLAAAEVLGQIGDAQAVKPLATALKDENKDVRQAAAEALGEIGNAQAVEPLSAALKDKESFVRQVAATSLEKIGDAQAVEPLVAALKNEDSYTRRTAARALGEIGDGRAVGPLVAMLKDKNQDVRAVAAEALGRIGDTRAVEPLVAALKDQYWIVWKAAAEALGQIRDARAVKPLLAALNNKSSNVREVATRVLKQIDPNWKESAVAKEAIPPTVAKEAIPTLVAALKDSDTQKAAAQALVRIGPAAVRPLATRLPVHSDTMYVKNWEWPEWAESRAIVDVLRQVLERSAGNIAPEDLRLIAQLQLVVLEIERFDICFGERVPIVNRPVVDCSQIKQLARQELIRRGLEA
jgi:HEAT repeat protein